MQYTAGSAEDPEPVEEDFDEGDEGDANGDGEAGGPPTVDDGALLARYLLYIEYNGTRFNGIQRQAKGERTVSGCVEAALLKLTKTPTKLYISSRTDTGVHSLGCTAHINVSTARPGKEPRAIPPESIASALNHLLERANNTDVSISRCLRVHPQFHARYHAKARTYFYRIHTGHNPPSVFEQDRMWHCKLKPPQFLDLERMKAAAKALSGTHDFKNFRGAKCKAPSTIRTLELSVEPCATWPPFPYGHPTPAAGDSPPLLVRAHSRSFLYHMVRLLVGTLKAVGVGELEVCDIPRIFAGHLPAPKLAPPQGLVLASVHYDPNDVAYNPDLHDDWNGAPLRSEAQRAATAVAAAAADEPEVKRARLTGAHPVSLVEPQSISSGEMEL